MLSNSQWLIGIIVAIIGCVSIRWVERYAVRHLMDTPNARSAHQRPTPRGGGIAIVFAFTISVLLTVSMTAQMLTGMMLCLAALMVAGIGWLDDHYSCSAYLRLLIQTTAALLWVIFVMYSGVSPEVFAWVMWVGVTVFFVFAQVYFINVVNFMDGIDGLAISESIFIACGLLIISQMEVTQWWCFLLIMASLGFIWRNFPPAKIFMGDVGSGWLGFVLSAFFILEIMYQPWQLVSILILTVSFWGDATLTLYGRWQRKQSLITAHSEHAYQHLTRYFQQISSQETSSQHTIQAWLYQRLARSNAHLATVVVYNLLNIFILLPLAILSSKLVPDSPLGALCCLVVALGITLPFFYSRGAGRAKEEVTKCQFI